MPSNLLTLLSCAFSYKPNDADGDGLPPDLDCNDDDPKIGAPDVDAYVDADGDGHGAGAAQKVCTITEGYSSIDGDCKDDDAKVYPQAPEKCNGVDDDCNELIDDNPVDPLTYYTDADGDGYGDRDTPVSSCTQPPGTVANSDDCNDTRADLNPDTIWYADADRDGYGDESVTQRQCEQPKGYVASAGDCNDGDVAYHPGAEVQCDSEDRNCDDVDDSVDGDGDGLAACAGDCLDTDRYSYPGATETPYDGIDQDCSGADLTDVDGDGFDAVEAEGDDCDDNNALINPRATETCNGVDEDCDGIADDDAVDATAWYEDADGDSYGNPDSSRTECSAPVGYVSNSGDCDDTEPLAYSGATEIPYDGIDQDCVDGDLTDVDGDGYDSVVVGGADCDDADAAINPLAVEIAYDGIDNDCADGDLNDVDRDGYIAIEAEGDDCDDTNTAINPGAAETCDASNRDENCNGLADNNDSTATGTTIYYADTDGDSYGDRTNTSRLCDATLGYTTNLTDCDDNNAAINPSATEVCDASNTDEDCDGNADDADSSATSTTIVYTDADLDGFGDATTATAYCDPPATVVTNNTDCDDADATTYPGAIPDQTEPIDRLWSDCNATYEEAEEVSSIALAQLTGDENNQLLGSGNGVLAKFDVDGDGFDDLIAGSPYEDTSAANAGGLYAVLSGTSSSGNISSVAYAQAYGAASSDFAGKTLISGGDLFGTGNNVLTVAASYNDDAGSNAGKVYLLDNLPSGSSDLSTIARMEISNSTASGRFGTALASADINADGNSDLLASAPYLSSNTGAVSIFLGPVSGSSADATYTGDTSGSALGEALCAGDFNGDGYDDWVVAAQGDDEAAIIFGSHPPATSGTRASVQNITFTGVDANLCGPIEDRDDDADRANELFVASKTYSSNRGAVAIFESADLASGGSLAFTDASMLLTGSAENNYLGTSIVAEDIDNDGVDDLLVGEPTTSASSGLLYLLWGDTFFSIENEELGGDQTGLLRVTGSGEMGSEIGIFDYDADSDYDIVIGAPYTDNGSTTSSGTVWVAPNNIN